MDPSANGSPSARLSSLGTGSGVRAVAGALTRGQSLDLTRGRSARLPPADA